MNQRPLKSLGLTVVALCWFMSCHLSSAVAQTREAKPPISPMQGYLIWTKVQKPDTEGLTLFAPEHIFLNGRFRVGRVQIQVERFSEGFFVADAAADTERIIRKMAEQIVKMQNIDKAEDVLLKVQDVGEEWFFPWNRPKKFFGFEIAEATWRDGNLKDPRGFNGLLALGMSSVSEEAAKKRKKEFEEALAAAKKDPKLGAVYSNLTGADMLQNLEDYGFASRNVTIARLQGMGSGSKWAANEYNRSRANGKKSPILENLKKIRADALEKFKTYEQNNQQVPEDQKIGFAMLEKEIARHMEAVEHDDDRLTIHVFVLAGKAPVQVSEDIVKKAVEIATEMKTIGLDYQNALDLKDWESGEFKKERDTLADTIAKIKAMNNEPSEFQIKQLAEMDKRLANEKKRLDTKVKFKTEYKYFAGEDDEDYWIWLPKFGEMRKKFDNRLVEIKADLKEMATERKHLYKQQQSLMQVEHFYMSKDIQETSPEKTINLADSKKLKNFIAQRSNELHGSDGPSPEPESQAGLIKEAEKSLKELADSSRQQWEKVKNNPASTLSEDNKKDLEKTARFWEDREKIVRL
ncbi:MAG: hypothetical protein K8T89_25065, partial [Planctomycetes bacterium]|nr:hypothetical protein [Planctomycetota bacterium]